MIARQKQRVACALVLLLASLGSELAVAQTPPSVAAAVLERLATENHARVLVELAVPSAPRGRSANAMQQRRASIAAQRRAFIAALGSGRHRVVHEFNDLPYVALDIDATALAAIQSASAFAVRVLEDPEFRPILSQSVPRIDAVRAHSAGLNGAGVAVAIIDSGVDVNHPFFADRLIDEACFASAENGAGGDCPNGQATQIGPGAGSNCTFAPLACGHGTHVAGIAVGNGAEFTGVAPAANLISIQVFHGSLDCIFFLEEVPCPRAFESDIVAALEHVYSLRDQYPIAAVNMSLGGTAYDSACDVESPLFAAAIDNLKSVQIATVAASGNDGLTIGIAEPACVASAVSVGATTTADDQVAWFSNNSADLDLLAPGSPITSSVPGGGFDTLEGTSMAAPHVAGAWAVYRQAHPTATVDETLAAFVDTGVAIADWRGGPTKPRIRVGSAVGIESPVPVLTSVSPTQVARYGPSFTLTVDGSGFGYDSQVLVDGIAQPTTYESETRLTATVAAEAIATSSASATITVHTPPPGGGTTDGVILSIVPSSVQVDATVVAPGETVTVTAINPPGWSHDWIALAKVGSSPSSYITYSYVISGPSWSVQMPSTPGEYEFRLLVNNSYTQVAVSPIVTVAEPIPGPDPDPPTLTPSTTTATTGQAVTVTLANSPGGSGDWLALAAVGSARQASVTFVYVGAGVTDRTWTVNMPSTPGEYEFRLFVNNSYTQVAASAAISVAAPAPDPDPEPTTLTPSTTSSAPGAPVTVTVANAPGGSGDWLALAAVGGAPSAYVTYTYVGAGVTDRTWTVNMPSAPGEYEFRLFVNNGYTQVAASAAISVAAPAPDPDPEPTTLTPSTTSAATDEAVTVTVANAPGGSGDWLALAKVGSSANAYLTYTYVGAGVTDRTWTVSMPSTPGDYEFRLFVNNSYTQVATSAAISVTAPAPDPDPAPTTLTPSTTTATTGAPVTVTLANSSGASGDWLALAKVGSAPAAYVTYTYVGAGVTDRTWTVNMPSTPGDYEFRLFANNGYTQIAASAAISVTAPVPDPDPEPATLTPSTASTVSGAPVTVTVANAPGGSGDWLALAKVGSPATTYVTYTYVGAGVTDRTWTVSMPSTPGEYEFRLFLNNGFTLLATSPPVIVN